MHAIQNGLYLSLTLPPLAFFLSFNRPTNQPTYQPANQSTNQPTNQTDTSSKKVQQPPFNYSFSTEMINFPGISSSLSCRLIE